MEGWMHRVKVKMKGKKLIVKGSLCEPTAYMKRGTFKIPHAHDPKTCRIYKCGMCAAVKG